MYQKTKWTQLSDQTFAKVFFFLSSWCPYFEGTDDPHITGGWILQIRLRFPNIYHKLQKKKSLLCYLHIWHIMGVALYTRQR